MRNNVIVRVHLQLRNAELPYRNKSFFFFVAAAAAAVRRFEN